MKKLLVSLVAFAAFVGSAQAQGRRPNPVTINHRHTYHGNYGYGYGSGFYAVPVYGYGYPNPYFYGSTYLGPVGGLYPATPYGPVFGQPPVGWGWAGPFR